mgnify:CR=1 FL=1
MSTNYGRVRVSVSFTRPERQELPIESRADRLKRLEKNTQDKRDQFVRWLERNHIAFGHISTAEAFNTIFLDVPSTEVEKLSDAPDVLDVVVDRGFDVELLEGSDE